MARPRPDKKTSEPAAPATSKILPMELRVGDRLADETGEWEVIGRPYTTAGGKTAHVRVQEDRMSPPLGRSERGARTSASA